jgi:putative ABC transport system permease protein
MLKLWRRFLWLLRRRRGEAELAAELEFHRAEHEAALERRGATPEDARAASHRTMGNLTLAREDARSVWLAPHVESVIQDVAYALRLLRNAPSFAATVIVVTALGIGTTTMVFALLDALVLKDLPVRHPEELVYFKNPSFSYPIFQEVKERATAVFENVAAWDLERISVQWQESLEPTEVLSATGDFYSVLGVAPAAGRLFAGADDRIAAGAERVAVISYDAWQRRFDRNPDVIGRIVRIGGQAFSIIGVAPAGFFGVAAGRAPELTVPVSAIADAAARASVSSSWLHLIARLRSGVTLTEANAVLSTFWPAVLEATTERDAPADRRAIFLGRKTQLMPARTGFSSIRNRYGDSLWLLFGLTTLLLGVACASAANLWLARGIARRREIAVRLAIGAGSWRVVRQLLTEAVMTTSAGAVAGIAFASWGGRTLVAMMSTSVEAISLDVHVDWRVLAFAGLLAIASIAVGAVAPAIRATRVDGGEALKQHGPAGGTLRGRWAQSLIAVQIALTATLLVGAALFVRSLNRIVSQDAGFDRSGVLIASTDAIAAGYRDDGLQSYYDAVVRRVRAIGPRVESVSVSLYPPISARQGSWTQSIGVDGGPIQREQSGEQPVYFNGVSSEYFRTLGMRLLRGRDFSMVDLQSRAAVAIVNESLARHAFGNRDPIGHRISVGLATARKDLEIIGIVQDSKYQRLQEPPRRIAYLPLGPTSDMGADQNLFVEVRTGDASKIRQAVSEAFRDINPMVPVRLETIDARIRESLVRERVLATLAAALGVTALLLACAAVYGLASYAVTRRTSEIGVRIAFGASHRHIVAMVLRGALTVLAVGLGAGLLVAAWLGRFVESLLFDVQSTDVPSFVAASAVLTIVTALSVAVPARRAARVNPVIALRIE